MMADLADSPVGEQLRALEHVGHGRHVPLVEDVIGPYLSGYADVLFVPLA